MPYGSADTPADWDTETGQTFAADGTNRAVVTTMSEVVPETIRWLWEGRFPAGKVVVIDGDPSLGKSTLALTLGAHVSSGKPWPDGTPCPCGDVVIMSAEDGLADTIRPRLDAAEADPARVHAITGIRAASDDGEVYERAPTLADIGHIGDAVRQTKARLLVIDVFMAYLPGKVDSHRDQDVRSVMARLAALAEETGCCVVLLRHLNKANAGSAIYRGGGSIGIVGAARAAYLVAPDPDDETVRVLAPTKNNLAPMPTSLSYRLEQAPGTTVARVVWCGESQHAAEALLSNADDRDDGDERREIDAWLHSYLTENGGSAPATAIYREGGHSGFGKDQLKRAKKRLHIDARKDGMRGGWCWELPPRDGEGSSQGSQASGKQSPTPFAPFAAPFERTEGIQDTAEESSLRRCTECGYPLDPVITEDVHALCSPEAARSHALAPENPEPAETVRALPASQVPEVPALQPQPEPGSPAMTCEVPEVPRFRDFQADSEPCDRCGSGGSRTNNAGSRLCATCAPSLFEAAS